MAEQIWEAVAEQKTQEAVAEQAWEAMANRRLCQSRHRVGIVGCGKAGLEAVA